VLEPVDLGEEERLFLAHPEMIVSRIFFHEQLKDDEVLLIRNVKKFNINVLKGTFYEDYVQNNNKNGAFALINERSVCFRQSAISNTSQPERVCIMS
jgi:Poly (ADP-ribose) glycohydrolase (PARG)